jgi:hypothetical protein
MNERHKADSAGKLQVKDRPPAGRAIKMRYAEVNGIKIAFDIRGSEPPPAWRVLAGILREIPITQLDRS